jgi:hypothetical protein
MRTVRVMLAAGAAGFLIVSPALARDDGALAAALLADAPARDAAPQAAGAFGMDVHGLMLLRYNWNHRDDDASEGSDANGFQTAYTKLQIGGHIINDRWSYGLQFKFTEGDGSAALDDAWGSYATEGGWVVRWGQFKAPLLREELVGDTGQLDVNRSVTNSVFSQSRSQGVQLSHEGEQLRVFAAFTDGVRTTNSDYTSMAEADWAVTGRAEWKWAGEWKQARDFTSFQGAPFFGMLGGAAHVQSGGDTVGTADAELFEATLDVSVEGSGWNVYAAGIYRNADPGDGDTLADMGFLVQGGVFVAPQWELFGRYDVVLPDDDRPADDSFRTVTAGANYYVVPASHAAKFSADVEFFLDAQEGSIAPASTLTGLLASDEDSQWALRLQMQLVY